MAGGGATKKVPWDRRLSEHMARKSWEAANDPARRSKPSFRTQIKSRYWWFAVLTFGGAVSIWFAAGSGWPRALAWALYVVSLIMSALSSRDARAALRSDQTDG